MLSKRAKRMLRHHKRGKASPLNLVSLMDIFTILVFFLLVNSSDVQELSNPKSVELPESIAEQRPEESVVVTVTGSEILVQGRIVASVSDATAQKGLVIEPLRAALADQAARRVNASGGAGEVTIVGDKTIPYRLLKRIMATCTEAEYETLSLAVMQRGAETSS